MRMISYNEASSYMKWSPKDREELYSIIDQATRYVENYLNYPLTYEEHIDYETMYRDLDGYICSCLPVQAISEIKINGKVIEGYRVTSYGFDYDLHNEDKIEVTYMAGYKPFFYRPCYDNRYEAGKIYCRKLCNDKYFEVYDYNINDFIDEELYIQEVNHGKDGLDDIIRMTILRVASVLHSQSSGNLSNTGSNMGNIFTGFDSRDIEVYLHTLNGLRRYPL